jgi:hypothetical protein
MGEMTIGELLNWLETATVRGLLALFILALYFGKLLWRHQHDEVITILKDEHAKREAGLIEQSEKREADLERLLDRAEKRGDEWLNMSVSQNRLAEKSLEVTATTVTTVEKPPA